ncbi:uncharacterized protein [Leptinotarsa decemlineata]|uniref:uncharacterized protein n=1 Tax=Leptinotarsa decemlineata TaxID=7539 RepID=UPI003D30BF3A
MASHEKEQERLQRLLEETLSEDLETNDAEVPFDESDIDESDHEEVTEHSSDSEQDIDNADENNDNYQMTAPSFIAKDNTYWKKHKPPRTAIRTRQENIIKRLPGPTQTTRLSKRPLEIWNHFFTDNHNQTPFKD